MEKENILVTENDIVIFNKVPHRVASIKPEAYIRQKYIDDKKSDLAIGFGTPTFLEKIGDNNHREFRINPSFTVTKENIVYRRFDFESFAKTNGEFVEFVHPDKHKTGRMKRFMLPPHLNL